MAGRVSKGGNTVGAAVPDAKTDARHCKSDAGANRPVDYLRGRDGGYAPRSRGLPPASGSFLGAAGFSEARGFRTMSGTLFALRLHLFSSLYIERAARLPEHAAHMQRDRAGYTRLVPPSAGVCSLQLDPEGRLRKAGPIAYCLPAWLVFCNGASLPGCSIADCPPRARWA